jgi:hypothetical protein
VDEDDRALRRANVTIEWNGMTRDLRYGGRSVRPRQLRIIADLSSCRSNVEPSRHAVDDGANRFDEALPKDEERFRIIYERAGVGAP